jgi:hypothetical protein
MFVVTDCACQHKRIGSNPDATLKGDAEDVSENEETKVPLSDDNPNRYRDEVKASKQFRKSKSVSSADRGLEPTIHLPKSETVTTDLDDADLFSSGCHSIHAGTLAEYGKQI